MEDNKAFSSSEEIRFVGEVPQKESPLSDFETLEASIYASENQDSGEFLGKATSPETLQSDFFSGESENKSGSITKREEISSVPVSDLLDFEQGSSLIDIESNKSQHLSESHSPQHEPLSIGSFELDDKTADTSPERNDSSPISFDTISQPEDCLPKIKDPKIESKPVADLDNYVSGQAAYKTTAQPEREARQVNMEAEKVAGTKDGNAECECPFSPGAWFNPEKLHPRVAEYIYWRDPKKSGIALGTSLVVLLCFKYFSVISVFAYLILTLLIGTASFRVYKSVLQAVQKSNEGHPFKEYLDMDVTLSQEKVGPVIETFIHHVNTVILKLRSLVLVEDMVDTIKFAILAWCLTYVGAWFNGLTLIILGVVSAFSLPKLYETNKTQIDTYLELVRTKGKEVMEMVNAKLPMGKKKTQ